MIAPAGVFQTIISQAGRRTRQRQSQASFTPIPRDQPVRRALAQLIREFARTPGTRPATLLALPPEPAAPEKTFMEVTRDAADGRTPATNRHPAAAAVVLRRRGA